MKRILTLLMAMGVGVAHAQTLFSNQRPYTPSSSFVPVTHTMTGSGTVPPGDRKTLVSCPANTTCSVTLGPGSTNGQLHTIKRYGPGMVVITTTLDGQTNYSMTLNISSPPFESEDFSWDAPNNTWQLN